MSSSGTADPFPGPKDVPNPFSRQGSDPADALGAEPQLAPRATENSWPTYPSQAPAPEPAAAEPYGQPSAPNFDPQPTPPYGGSSNADPANPYAANPYASNPYASNPYEVTSYQASYGGYGAYGIVPTIHPQAVPALVTGIIGLALLCGPVGIFGLVLGHKARKAIDAEPGRYSGRGQATAGFVLGIISTVMMVLYILFFAAGLSGSFDSLIGPDLRKNGTMSNSYGEQSDQNPYSQPSAPGPYDPSGYGQPPEYGQQSEHGQQSSYSQPPAYGAQPAYGVQPAYGTPYGAPAPEHERGTLILVFGILGIFFGIFAPVAWYMGSQARKEIAASGARYANEANINIGRILGMVFTIIYVVSIVFSVVFFVIIAGFAASQGG